MSRIRIKNWSRHQHFKDRTPPWIKLYRELLNDPDWHDLDGDTTKVLIGLWLIASEDETHQGLLPDVRKLAFRLRMSERSLNQALTKLSAWVIQDDIAVISGRYQVDALETETETETETEAETEERPRATKSRRATHLLAEWMPSDREGHEPSTNRATNRATNAQPNQTPDTRHQTTTVVPVGEVVGCGEEDAVADKPRRPASHGYRLPANWTPTPEDIAYCRARRPELEPLEVAEAFREFWWAKAGAAARKADWSLTWRTWVRNERTPAPRVNGKHAERQRIASEIAAIARGDSNGTVIDITPRAATPALGGPFV